jgi:uncharacterized protein (TIGR02757 family)
VKPAIQDLASFLRSACNTYNSPAFIENDPVCIPHRFTRKQDIEITGFFAAVFAWGQRVTIINKCGELIARMDDAPFDFVMNHSDKDLQRLVGFKHRTFNDTDLLYFIAFFHFWYTSHDSLEDAFAMHMKPKDLTVENGLNGFRNTFFSLPDIPQRTFKHIASPMQNSACKRINMYLRWMVRKDHCGVDFGIWKKIRPSQLVCPLDVHVQRVAMKLNLLQRGQSDWKAATELTENLRALDKKDPVKYDFALFGLGVTEKF